MKKMKILSKIFTTVLAAALALSIIPAGNASADDTTVTCNGLTLNGPLYLGDFLKGSTITAADVPLITFTNTGTTPIDKLGFSLHGMDLDLYSADGATKYPITRISTQTPPNVLTEPIEPGETFSIKAIPNSTYSAGKYGYSLFFYPGCDLAQEGRFNWIDWQVFYSLTKPVSVSGTIGEEIAPQTVDLTSAYEFTDISIDDDVTSWFTNIPSGLSATVASVSDNNIKFTITGTPSQLSTEEITLKIPGTKIVNFGYDFCYPNAFSYVVWNIGAPEQPAPDPDIPSYIEYTPNIPASATPGENPVDAQAGTTTVSSPSWSDVADAAIDMADGEALSINVTDSSFISKLVLRNIQYKDKSISLISDSFIWDINGKDIYNPHNVNPSAFYTEPTEEMKDEFEGRDIKALRFRSPAYLGFVADFSVLDLDEYDGQTATLYMIKNGNYIKISDAVVTDGKVVFDGVSYTTENAVIVF